MKRIVGMIVAVAVLFVGASPAFAGPVKDEKANTSASAPKTGSIFTKAAIEKAVAKSVAKSVAKAAAPTPARRSGGSFWKTPWPYVIIGGSVAAYLIIHNKSDGVGIY